MEYILLTQACAIRTPSVFTRGDIDQIQRLINSKVDVNQGDYDSRTAIHVVTTEYLIQRLSINLF